MDGKGRKTGKHGRHGRIRMRAGMAQIQRVHHHGIQEHQPFGVVHALDAATEKAAGNKYDGHG